MTRALRGILCAEKIEKISPYFESMEIHVKNKEIWFKREYVLNFIDVQRRLRYHL
jgi:hypothetical protein